MWVGDELRTKTGLRLVLMAGGMLFVTASVTASATAAERPVELPLDVRPYRVRLAVAFDAPQLSEAVQRELLLATQQAAQRCVGETWQLRVESLPWLQPVSAAGLARLKAVELIERADPKEPPGEPTDVWFVAAVQAARPGYRVEVRAWQPEIQLALEGVGDHVVDPRAVPQAILKLCWRAFRPVGVVEDVEGLTARLRLRAGAFAAPDGDFALAQPHDTFAASIAARNREQRIERLQSIPWTYLTATEVDGSRVTASIGSGLRSPIGGKQRGRIETLVIAVRPQHAATRLELVTQTKPSLPLVAHRIELRRSSTIPHPDDATARAEHLLRELLTDRRGLVTIPVDRERPLVWLFAYSGQHLLARVPCVPGCDLRARLEVPDDASRLAAEADVQMLQGQLIDAVAARNTQIALVRAAAKQSDWKLMDAKLADLTKLEEAQSFLDRLVAVRVPAVNVAKGRKDRAGEARINRLCDDMATLIRQYLSEDKLKQIHEEAAELRKSEQGAERK